MKELNEAIQRNRTKYGSEVVKKAPANEANAMVRFTHGPAMEIFPISSRLAGPAIITAPGAISRSGVNTEINVITAPHGVSLNSAHKPARWAMILCASS